MGMGEGAQDLARAEEWTRKDGAAPWITPLSRPRVQPLRRTFPLASKDS